MGPVYLNSALSNTSVKTEADLVKLRKQNPTQYSIRQKFTAQDPSITGINNQYKKELEEAYSNNANNNQLAAIMNAHQQALAEYLKSKGEAQKERSKIRAAELQKAVIIAACP